MTKPHRAIGLIIRDAMLNEGEISPYDFWKNYRPDVSYSYIRMVFWILYKLGLIEKSRKTGNIKGSPYGKVYYTVNRDRIEDPCWASPQKCYERFYK